MKIRILLATLFCLTIYNAGAQVCAGTGNLMLYTNYDGGIININVDQNIPNLKIGICTYEPVQVTISGAFVGNVTQVLYAGYNSTQNNNNCNQGNFITSITGVPANIVDIQTIPQANLQNPNGYPFIICAYQCDTIGSQGGCNTVDQVVSYFVQQTGGNLYAHHIQYNCWLNTTFNVSAGGTCCITAPGLQGPTPLANFTVDNDTICQGECLSFTNSSVDATSYQWSFPGATPSSSTDENPTFVCYTAPGTYNVSLIATNANGSDTTQFTNYINVANPAVNAQFNYQQTSNYVIDVNNTSTGATSYLWQLTDTSFTDANPTFSFPSEGVYPVTLIAYGACGNDTVTINVTVVKTALDENMLLKSISIYPNPAGNNLFIKTQQPLTYTVCDVVGKTILSGNANGLTNIDIATLSKGLYFIRIAANGQQAVNRFVKE